MTAILQEHTPEAVAQATGCDLTTARKVVAAVHQRACDDVNRCDARGIRRNDVALIAARYRIGRLSIVARQASSLDPFVKYLLETEDGARIETVRIPLERPGRFVVCVSSQVGCALGCTFCSTGRLGLTRNLEAWEIVEQVRIVRRELPAGSRVHGVVFQGMGEPLANFDRVLSAIRVLHDPCGQAIDQRAITVCTVGLPAGIRKLAQSGVRVRLGVSITSARREVRRRLVPIENHHSLDEVLDAAAEFVARHGDAPMFAVTSLSGVNTSEEDARALEQLVREFRERTGVAPRISLVAYNPPADPAETSPSEAAFRRAEDEEAAAFRARLSAIGVPVVRRYSGGSDVGAACGQLVGALGGAGLASPAA